jgi:hypothetical protein
MPSPRPLAGRPAGGRTRRLPRRRPAERGRRGPSTPHRTAACARGHNRRARPTPRWRARSPHQRARGAWGALAAAWRAERACAGYAPEAGAISPPGPKRGHPTLPPGYNSRGKRLDVAEIRECGHLPRSSAARRMASTLCLSRRLRRCQKRRMRPVSTLRRSAQGFRVGRGRSEEVSPFCAAWFSSQGGSGRGMARPAPSHR